MSNEDQRLPDESEVDHRHRIREAKINEERRIEAEARAQFQPAADATFKKIADDVAELLRGIIGPTSVEQAKHTDEKSVVARGTVSARAKSAPYHVTLGMVVTVAMDKGTPTTDGVQYILTLNGQLAHSGGNLSPLTPRIVFNAYGAGRPAIDLDDLAMQVRRLAKLV